MPQTAEVGRPATLEEIITGVAKAYKIAPEIALAVAKRESSLNPNVQPGDGGKAIGLFQLHDAAAQDAGVDKNDPFQNVVGGVKHLKMLSDRYQGDVQKILQAYNGGQEYVDRGAVSPQAQAYASEVLRDMLGGQKPAGTPNSAGPVKTTATDPLKPVAPSKPASGYLAQKSDQYGTALTVPKPQPTAKERVKAAMDQAQKDVIGDPATTSGISKGLRQSAARLAIGGGELVAPVLRKIPGVSSLVATPEQFDEARKQFATPSTKAEKVGSFAGDVAQFAVPAGQVAKLGAGVKVASQLVRAGVSASRARVVAGLIEGAAQGATAAGVATTRGDEGVGTTAAINAVLPVAARAVEIGGPALREAAEKKVAQLLASGLEGDSGPLVKEAIKAGQTAATAVRSSVGKAADIVRSAAGQLLDLPVNASWGKWQTMLASRAESAKKLLGTALKGPLGDVEIPTAGLQQELDNVIASSAQHFAQTGPGAVRPLAYDEPLLKQLTVLKDQLAQYGGKITVRNLTDIKRVWDKTVYTLATSGKVNADPSTLVSSAMKEAAFTGANAIREALDTVTPNTISKLNDVVSHAIRLEDLVKKVHLAKPAMSDATRNTVTVAGMIGGGVAGQTMGHGFLGAHIGGGAARMMTRALESPAWSMVTPKMKAMLADAIQAGRGMDVVKILAPVISASQPPQAPPVAASR